MTTVAHLEETGGPRGRALAGNNLTAGQRLPREQVRFVLSRFEDFDYPDRAYEFVNAEFSLPFISAAAFPSVFTKVMASVKIGGLFTGQLTRPQ